MSFWRPWITNHALGRYLERVLLIPVPFPGEDVGTQIEEMRGDLERRDLIEAIWPRTIPIKADPGCRFVMRRDGFQYYVESGRMLTVLPESAGPWRPNKRVIL